MKTNQKRNYKNSINVIQGRLFQNGYFEFDFWNTSTPISLVYLASNQQLLKGI